MNEKGSTSLMFIPLGLVIAVVACAFNLWFDSHLKLQARNRAMEDSKNLATSLKMMFSSRANCAPNISSNGFGTSLNGLSSQTNVKLVMPGTDKPLISAGQNYAGLSISALHFASPRTIAGSLETSYIADLTVYYKTPMDFVARSFVVPVYLLTDGAGTLTDCFMTSYMPLPVLAPAGALAMTAEDLICTQLAYGDGQAHVFLPQNNLCVVKPATNPSVVQN